MLNKLDLKYNDTVAAIWKPTAYEKALGLGIRQMVWNLKQTLKRAPNAVPKGRRNNYSSAGGVQVQH